MSRPLDLIGGSFDSAVFTTFSINLHFFEQRVLPLLRQSGIRNIIVFADHQQLGRAVAAPGISQAGRSYHLISVRLGPGAFHPKIILLNSSKDARVCISSANLTVDGQLRNTEGFVSADSNVSDQASIILETCSFLRRLATDAPSHVVPALMKALDVDLPNAGSSTLRLVHNLDRPIVEELPNGPVEAVTAFGDSGEAIARIKEGGPIKVWVDGDHFAAGTGFFKKGASITPLTFESRMHGKAIWARNKKWVLIGSPNLTHSALLKTASEGNTEVAVFLETELAFPLPPNEPWDGGSISATASMRLKQERLNQEISIGSLDSWEDDDVINVSANVPDGASVEWDAGGTWKPMGEVKDHSLVPPEGERPYRIRGEWANRLYYSVVQRVNELRIRAAKQGTGRAAEVTTTLPLDIQGVKVLESVLKDLFALDELAATDLDEGGDSNATSPTAPSPQVSTGLSEWRPARAEDEPRIPDVYRRVWRNDPDALLALVRKALRLNEQDLIDELGLIQEHIDLLELDTVDSDREQEQVAQASKHAQGATDAVLQRYRKAFVDLLARGVDFVLRARHQDLADLAFQTILQFHDQLAKTTVEIRGHTQALVPIDLLIHQKARLLDAYLVRRDGNDPLCLATAAFHLADCLRASVWTPAEWESLETLSYSRAGQLLKASLSLADSETAIPRDVVEAWLDGYARSSNWDRAVEELDLRLEDIRSGSGSVAWVEGAGFFTKQHDSQAWKAIGELAVAGTRLNRPFGVVVRNDNISSNFDLHCIAFDPDRRKGYSAARRRKDGHWLPRVFHPVSAAILKSLSSRGADVLNELAQKIPLSAGLEVTDEIIPHLLQDSSVFASKEILPT